MVVVIKMCAINLQPWLYQASALTLASMLGNGYDADTEWVVQVQMNVGHYKRQR